MIVDTLMLHHIRTFSLADNHEEACKSTPKYTIEKLFASLDSTGGRISFVGSVEF